MSNSTRREAERITADLGYHGGWQAQQALTDAIDKALQARDERAARICNNAESPDYEHGLTANGWEDAKVYLADAIRKDD
jgi:hypothetical protein